MAREFPDVLDGMGKTPREFGTVHVHFEGFQVVDGRRCVASVLSQAAFVPCEPAVLHVFEGGVEIARALVPALEDGRVVRQRIACVRAADGPLGVLVEAFEPSSKASRVRQAWKLFDTFEIPKLSEMKPVRAPGGLDVAGSIALSMATGPLLGAVVLRFDSTTTLPANNTTKVHRAMELPQMLSGALLEGIAKPVEGVEEEILWQVGQPVPEPPPLVPIARQEAMPEEKRWCRHCSFEGSASEHRNARSCPRCDEPWF